MKIIICVLSLEKEPYISLEKTIRETWGNNTTPKCRDNLLLWKWI